MDLPLDGVRPTEESYRVARSLVIRIGAASILEEHLFSLAAAPLEDLRSFARERGAIIFADTFLGAATSAEAGVRRGSPLDGAARRRFTEFDAAGERVFGVYDPQLHALIFTPHATPSNHEHVTLHELGHARTLPAVYRVAHLRRDLLNNLPRPIREVLNAYPQGDDRAAVRERVLEVFAEAYVWTVVGRWNELPKPLFYALQRVLTGERVI
jgi:hypothetical protein